MEQKHSLTTILIGYLYIILGMNFMGFITWVIYQISTKQVDFLYSMSLTGFLCIWWNLVLTIGTPIMFVKIFEFAYNNILEEQRIKRLKNNFLMIKDP